MKYRRKRGEGHIWPCVLTVAVCMILTAFVTFVSSYAAVRQLKRNTRVVLDSYVMTDSIGIYNSVKQGTDETDSLDTGRFVSKLTSFCTLTRNGNYYYSYDGGGRVQYYISEPSLCFSTQGRLRIYTEFRMYIPVYFADAYVCTATVPLKIGSEFSGKLIQEGENSEIIQRSD